MSMNSVRQFRLPRNSQTRFVSGASLFVSTIEIGKNSGDGRFYAESIFVSVFITLQNVPLLL